MKIVTKQDMAKEAIERIFSHYEGCNKNLKINYGKRLGTIFKELKEIQNNPTLEQIEDIFGSDMLTLFSCDVCKHDFSHENIKFGLKLATSYQNNINICQYCLKKISDLYNSHKQIEEK